MCDDDRLHRMISLRLVLCIVIYMCLNRNVPQSSGSFSLIRDLEISAYPHNERLNHLPPVNRRSGACPHFSHVVIIRVTGELRIVKQSLNMSKLKSENKYLVNATVVAVGLS